jgi:hypothetical protein
MNPELSSLLPFGDGIKPLLVASSLSEYDLKFLLQKRGVFVKSSQRNSTVPHLASMLLSPNEFETLRNRQHQKESNIKRTTAQSEWVGRNISVADVLSDKLDTIIKNLSQEDSSYSIKNHNITYLSNDKILIEGEIERRDWTKDVFSITSLHPWKFTIEKAATGNIVEYIAETTVPETKQLTNLFQTRIHQQFQISKTVDSKKTIQKIIATHFKGNHFIFEYLFCFTKLRFSSLKFQRIIDIEAGIDNRLNFPDNFKWLKGNIGELRLTAVQGKKLEETDIIEIGKLGILILGEIDAEFNFAYQDIKGKCVIQYGFPKFYDKRNQIEFETRIQRIDLSHECSHVSKETVKRHLLAEFQRDKHAVFEDFRNKGKVDPDPKDEDNQYGILFPWAG